MDFGLTWFWEWELRTQLIVLGVVFIYFFPTYLAIVLRKKDWPGMFLFNFLIGWSIIGWFLILNWVIGG
jgi:hypothetical protein